MPPPLPPNVRNNRANNLVYNQVDEWVPLSFAMDIADGVAPLTSFITTNLYQVKEVRIVASKPLRLYRDPTAAGFLQAALAVFTLPVVGADKKVYLQAVEDGTLIQALIFGFKAE